jgi:hypothetical protein
MKTPLGFWLAAASVVTLAIGPLAAPDKPTIKRVAAPPISSVDGKDNYRDYAGEITRSSPCSFSGVTRACNGGYRP